MDEPIDPAWRGWVRWCVVLGAWLAATSVLWTVLLVLVWTREGLRGRGPLPIPAVLALADVALLGNLGRWWMTPRWPHRQPRGRLAAHADPLGVVLPAATGIILVLNVVLIMSDPVSRIQWLGLALCGVCLVLLAVVLRSAPRPVGPP
ncbi:MAG: hypothetical protein WCF04_07240 [Candidatus Nanopelagicales bacterium]